MNTTKSKIVRVRRLRQIEESSLQATVIQLAEIQAKMKQHRSHIDRLKFEISNTHAGETVQSLIQSSRHTQHLQTQIDGLSESLQVLEAEETEVYDLVVAQKTKVNGWDNLITRLDSEYAKESEQRQSLLADDQHLSRRAQSES